MKTVLALIAVVWFISIACVLLFASRDGAHDQDGQSVVDAIVVLGAAQYAGRPSPVLRARVDHAIALWRRDTASVLLFTGGTGTGDTTSEALVASTYARRHGVPSDAILLESHGRTTSESMRAVAALIHARRLKNVVLVSDPFHMFRLWIMAHKVGFSARTSPTRTSPIAASTTKNWGYILSESFKAPAAYLIE